MKKLEGTKAPKGPKALEGVFFKQKSDSREKDALLFLAIFAALALGAYLLLSSTGQMLHNLAAHSSVAVMGAIGIKASVVPASPFPHIAGTLNGTAFEAEINDLCAGAIELAILFGIVMASRDKTIKQRLLGVLAGFAVFLIFNPLRIALTLSAVGSWALPLLHDVLFRLSLLIAIVGFYAVWSYATPSRRF